MVKIGVKKLSTSAQLPRYAHTGEFGDLAADVYASEAVTLAAAGEAGSTAAVPTGIAMDFPSTHGARPASVPQVLKPHAVPRALGLEAQGAVP